MPPSAALSARANPLLDFADLPDFSRIAPAHAAAAIDSACARVRAATAAVCESTKPPTWANTVAPIEAAEERRFAAWAQIDHLHSVCGAADWRAAHAAALPLMSRLDSELGQHEGLFARMSLLQDRVDKSEIRMSRARRKILLDSLRDFELAGARLSRPARAEFRKNAQRLDWLAAKFQENLLDATGAFGLDVKSEKGLGEMPDDIKKAARAAAGKRGGFRFTLQAPSYAAFMRYSSDRAAREKMQRAHATRASDFGPKTRDNTPIVAEILKLRGRQSRLLGFKNFAEAALSRRMAKTPAAALDFLRDLAARARPAAAGEWAQLRDFARRELGIDDLRLWDYSFAAEKERRSRFFFSAAEARAHLPAARVFAGLFEVARALFGIRFRAARAGGGGKLWHESARLFEARDAAGGVVGRLFVDADARAQKRGGAWMGECLARFVGGGRRQIPAAHMVCNFSSGAGGEAMLDWEEVEILFHEFGHALHHLLARQNDLGASGLHGVEWDAVELPSQFLESFVWNWRVARSVSGGAGGAMPRALFDKLLAARNYHAGLRLARQLEFAFFDLFLHCGDSLARAAAKARKEAAVAPTEKWSRFYCGFSHIFGGGYAAGYYSYLWAEVLAADAYARFASSPRGVLDSRLGAKFAREILHVGGARPAAESFERFQNRPPRIDALLAQYGLAATA